jgi:benzoyl-CoA reductase/2-hydroxyglutaryl-CoA dehydratase subunit BcrC/BadD/HgdB
VLHLESELERNLAAQTVTRLEAFLEMVAAKGGRS